MTSDDEAIDRALRGLPSWNPPSGLGARLAGAASRQSIAMRTRRPPPAGAGVLGVLNGVVPATVGAGLFAVLMVELPWTMVVARPAQTGLAVAAVLAVVGLRWSWRTLVR